MSTPAWQVLSWHSVEATVQEWSHWLTRYKLLAASINPDPRHEALRCGQVLWGVRTPNKTVGMAWDWAEVKPDVITLSDPMTVLSNLTLIHQDGEALTEGERLLCLNRAIHALPWQQRLLGQARAKAKLAQAA